MKDVDQKAIVEKTKIVSVIVLQNLGLGIRLIMMSQYLSKLTKMVSTVIANNGIWINFQALPNDSLLI